MVNVREIRWGGFSSSQLVRRCAWDVCVCPKVRLGLIRIWCRKYRQCHSYLITNHVCPGELCLHEHARTSWSYYYCNHAGRRPMMRGLGNFPMAYYNIMYYDETKTTKLCAPIEL
jgi:hypothetical protein